MIRILHLFILLISLVSFSQQPYYNDVDLKKTGLALKNELAYKITVTHTNTLTYDQAREALKIIDLVPSSTTHVYLLYGFSNNTCPTSPNDDNDHRTRLSTSFGGGTSCEWNREHTYPQSLGSPELGQSGPGADVHHLRACDVQRNGSRGNLKFIAGSGNSGAISTGWYPGDEWKGDVARMMMYMYLRYGTQCLPSNVAIGTTNTIDANMINVLLQWNQEDPVSTYEDTRNSYLSNSSNTYFQGNRNPFIDNPYLATIIWGGPVAQDRWNMNNDIEAPTAPTNLTSSNITASGVTLNWTASTDNVGVTDYDVFINNVFLATTANITYAVTGLAASTVYAFKVRAKDAAANVSTFSNEINITTLAGSGGGGGTTVCGTETFTNIGTASSSYTTYNWTGDNGVPWTATDARNDETINGKAITIRNGSLTSGTISGGISELTVKTLLKYTGTTGDFKLKINGNTVGTIPYRSTEQTVTLSGFNIVGNIIISIVENSTTTNRVAFDDLTWKCYDASLSTSEYLNTKFRVYPNPANNAIIFITVAQSVEVKNIDVLQVTGKRIQSIQNPIQENNIIKISDLSTGFYILKIETDQGIAHKKIIIN